MRIGVITNPNSRKNQNKANRAKSLQSILGEWGTVYETSGPEAIKPILRDTERNSSD